MPQSMTMMSSPYRSAMIFMPNSPSPPRGITCNFRSDIKIEIPKTGAPVKERRVEHVSLLGSLGRPHRIGAGEAGAEAGRRLIAGRMAETTGAGELPGRVVDKQIVDHIVAAR